jgi:uncharacterized membrane protein
LVDIITATVSLVFSAVTIGVFIAMGFYAIRNLRAFRGGLLSKGWRDISIAVFFFIAGQLLLDSGAGQAVQGMQSLAMYNIFLGSVAETVGGLLLVLGFRTQSNIWRIEKGSAVASPSLSSSRNIHPTEEE